VVRLYAAWRADHHAAEVVAEVARRLNAFCAARYPGQSGGSSTWS
jgi:hypothetical protein